MTTLLSRDQYLATFSDDRARMDTDSFNVPFVCNYLHQIPKQDLQGFEIVEAQIPDVWETGEGKYAHVLVSTTTENVFVVILLNNEEEAVYGHYLLDLNEEYGIEQDEQVS